MKTFVVDLGQLTAMYILNAENTDAALRAAKILHKEDIERYNKLEPAFMHLSSEICVSRISECDLTKGDIIHPRVFRGGVTSDIIRHETIPTIN